MGFDEWRSPPYPRKEGLSRSLNLPRYYKLRSLVANGASSVTGWVLFVGNYEALVKPLGKKPLTFSEL